MQKFQQSLIPVDSGESTIIGEFANYNLSPLLSGLGICLCSLAAPDMKWTALNSTNCECAWEERVSVSAFLEQLGCI